MAYEKHSFSGGNAPRARWRVPESNHAVERNSPWKIEKDRAFQRVPESIKPVKVVNLAQNEQLKLAIISGNGTSSVLVTITTRRNSNPILHINFCDGPFQPPILVKMIIALFLA